MASFGSYIGAIAVACFCTPTLAQAENWFCDTKASGGIRYNQLISEWDGAIFSATRTFLVSEASEDDDDFAYKVTEVGDSAPFATCQYPPDPSGFMSCSVGYYNFAFFNKTTLSLQLNYIGPAVNLDTEDAPEQVNDVFIEIADCSPI